MPRRIDFYRTGIGCIADGSYGQAHIRERLAELVAGYGRKGKQLALELAGEMSDDASEEDDAIDLLNRYCEAGIYFTMSNGDLLLVDEGFCE